jgi:hypothetical protein
MYGTAAFELPLASLPVSAASNFLKNYLPLEAKVAITLRLLRGGKPITESVIDQAAYLCTARRGKIAQHLKFHGNLGQAIAKAFRRASAKDRVAFIRDLGCEQIWTALTAN